MAVLSQMLLSAASVTPLTLAFNALNAFPSDGQTVTYTGVSIGAAAGDRYVFCTIPYYNGGASNIAISSVTIGGVAATIHSQPFQASATRGGVALVSALVPTGTTANVVITWASSGGGFYRPQLAIYRVTGLLSDTPVDLVTNTASSGSSQSLTVNTTAGGFAILGCSVRDNTKTLSGGLTTDYNMSPVANYLFIGGSTLTAATGTQGATLSGGVSAIWAVVMASFR